MSKRKKTPFASWESNKSDGFENRYIRCADTQLMSAAMKRLGDKAFWLYIYMRLESGGKREFRLPYARIRQLMPITDPTIKAAITELKQAGLIDVVESNANLRQPNLYAFSTRWRTMA